MQQGATLMKVIITGGAGFIGSHLCQHHLLQGDTVIAIDNLSSGRADNLNEFRDHKNFRLNNTSIEQCDDFAELARDADYIYHLAATVGVFNVIDNPIATLKNNISATLKIYDTIQDQPKKPTIIIASTSEVYGSQAGKLSENQALLIDSTQKNRDSYAISKLCDESIAYAYYRKQQIPCVVLRPFNTIGPRQVGRYGMVVPRFIEQAVSGKAITVFGDGQQKRAFCDVRDSVQFIREIAQNPKSIGEIVNVGQQQVISMNELALKIKTLANSDADITHVSLKDAYSVSYVDIEERCPDLKKLKSLTQHRYQFCLDDTLNTLIQQERSRQAAARH
jgi:UDP-glucose 4-epimerase